MATTYYNDIQKLYVAYFNRPADAAGLAYYEGVLEGANGSAETMAQISADFAKSSEYTAAFNGKTSAQIVDIIYQNLFGHAADAAGKKYYADYLDAKTLTVANVVTEVAKGAQGTDLTVYNNKLTAAAAFTAAVDTDAEKAGYSGDEANAIAKEFLAGVTTDASLAAAIAPSALNVSVAEAVAAGTDFTLQGALATLDAANSDLADYLASDDVVDFVASVDDSVDTDDTDAVIATIEGSTDAAEAAIADQLDDTAAATLYGTTSSAAVKAALIDAQEALNAATLEEKQGDLADANDAIADVAGLTAAVAALTAATKAEKTATTAATAAAADLAAKEASFGVTYAGAVKVATVDGKTVLQLDYTSTTKTDIALATIDANGKATLASGVDASKFTGLTALITSFNADVAAKAAVEKAGAAVDAAQLNVNHLDVAADSTEADLLDQVTASINAYAEAHPTALKAVADGETATEAQITTALKVMQAANAAEYATFNTLVNSYHTAAEDNPLLAAQEAASDAVDAATDKIDALADAVAALADAKEFSDALHGYQDVVAVAAGVLEDNGYTMGDLSMATIATADSDVYIAGSDDAEISLFGLQGSDSLLIGSQYTIVNGSMADEDGNNATLEAFISNNDDGDAQIQLETHAYSSNVSTTAGEVVTITLVGVDAADLVVKNGIITLA